MLEKHDVRKNRNGRSENGAKDLKGDLKDSSKIDTKAETKVGRALAGSGATLKSVVRPAVAGLQQGMSVRRYFTKPGDDGFTNVQWELRTAAITGENGKSVFEQRDVEVPKSWTQTATNVVVQKYFRGTVGTPQRERSVRQLISRVADTITNWGIKDGFFARGASDGES